MGNRSSKVAAQATAKMPDNRYKVVFQVQNERIPFDPSQSCVLCVGIDAMTKSPSGSLGKLVKSDCMALAEACGRDLGIPGAKVKTVIASEQPHELLTEAGLSTLLVDAASSVGSGGILVFAFSGHGATVTKNGSDQASLVLVNHTRKQPDCLTGRDLVRLVSERAGFRGRNALLVLDCCFSGGVSRWTRFNDEDGGKFRCITACSAYQTSLQLDPLGHSVFTYFLLDALEKSKGISPISDPGANEGLTTELCLKEVFEHTSDSSWALSSMYIQYDPSTQSLYGCTMTPEVSNQPEEGEDDEDTTDGVEMTDGESCPHPLGRMLIVQKYWRTFPSGSDSRRSRVLSQNSYRWLKQQVEAGGPLLKLKEKDHLSGRVLQAVLCTLARSVASIHLYEKNSWNGSARLFIVDYTEIVSVVEFAYEGEIEDGFQFAAAKQVLAYYYVVYRNAGFKAVEELRTLFRLLAADQLQHMRTAGQEAVDGPGEEKMMTVDLEEDDIDVVVSLIPVWKPLYTPTQDTGQSLVPIPEYYIKHHDREDELVLEQELEPESNHLPCNDKPLICTAQPN